MPRMNTTTLFPPTILSPRELTEGELIERLLARDAEGWREFHRRYDRLIHRCIHKVTDRFRRLVHPTDLEDIYGDLLVSLTTDEMRRLRAFDPAKGSKLGSWIGMLSTHAAWDHLRKLRRRPAASTLEEAIELSAETPAPLDVAIAHQRLEAVRAALSEFSAKDQELVQLLFIACRSAEETALEMGISVKTVYSKKHKIRAKLRARLTGSESACAA
ncbi:MAG: sigma-70 family RNA polymerase sigma factor [Deltaproteobacteria bacterium]|nr:sigma-70 family RNA polymerase sigma factor [Deltaproteobacteria bacterium]